jgi:hypothetical protein
VNVTYISEDEYKEWAAAHKPVQAMSGEMHNH